MKSHGFIPSSSFIELQPTVRRHKMNNSLCVLTRFMHKTPKRLSWNNRGPSAPPHSRAHQSPIPPSHRSEWIDFCLFFHSFDSSRLVQFSHSHADRASRSTAHMTHDTNNPISMLAFNIIFSFRNMPRVSVAIWNGFRIIVASRARFTRRQILVIVISNLNLYSRLLLSLSSSSIAHLTHSRAGLCATPIDLSRGIRWSVKNTRAIIFYGICARRFHHQNVKCLQLIHFPDVQHDHIWYFECCVARVHTDEHEWDEDSTSNGVDDGRPHTQETHFDLSQFPCKMYSFEWRWRRHNWNITDISI